VRSSQHSKDFNQDLEEKNMGIGTGYFLWSLRSIAVGLSLFLLSSVCPRVLNAADFPSPVTLMWQVHFDVGAEELKSLANAGVNVIQSFGFAYWNDERIKGYLEKAQRNNMKVIPYLGEFFKRGTTVGEAQFDDDCAAFINKWKDSPNIAAWHIADEPKEKSKAVNKYSQGKAYKFVKALDPERPVMISMNLTSQEEYDLFFTPNSFDILDLHSYVNPEISQTQRDLVMLFLKNGPQKITPVITIRAFNGPGWKDLGEDGLQRQYDFFVKQMNVSKSMGFYGWSLSPNRGIRDVAYIRNQFFSLKK
jgi:hypothetical protein